MAIYSFENEVSCLLAVCVIVGVMLIALGVIGEILKAQRRITEESLYLQRRELHRPQDAQP